MRTVRCIRRATTAVAAITIVVLAGCSSSGHGRATAARNVTPSSVPSTTASPSASVPDGEVYAHTKAGDLSPTVAAMRPRVWVPNSEDNTVDVIDPTTFAVIDHFAVGKLPQHVAPSWDLKTLFVTNDLGDTLTPIDPATGQRGADIPVADPYNLYFTPDGTKAVVVAERLQRLDFRDPHTWQLIKSVPIPTPGVDHIDFSADGKYLLASCEFSGTVVKVDVDKMEEVASLNTGGQPVDVKLA